MTPGELRATLESILNRLSSRGFDTRPLVFDRPASADELADLESRLGFGLPPKFRSLLQQYSRHVEFRWFTPDGVDFAMPFQSNFSGDLHWSLEFTEQLNADKNDWIKTVFPDPEDPYDAVWHNKLAFYEVGNGDYLAVDLAPERYEEIVYLSHDDGEGHGHVMAANAIELIRRWVPLGCAGGDDNQWLPFTDSRQSPIEPNSDTAEKWRWILGLSN